MRSIHCHYHSLRLTDIRYAPCTAHRGNSGGDSLPEARWYRVTGQAGSRLLSEPPATQRSRAPLRAPTMTAGCGRSIRSPQCASARRRGLHGALPSCPMSHRPSPFCPRRLRADDKRSDTMVRVDNRCAIPLCLWAGDAIQKSRTTYRTHWRCPPCLIRRYKVVFWFILSNKL